MEIVPFVRVDYYDATFQESDPDFDLPSFVVPTIGLTYRPVPQVVFKFDYPYECPSTGAIANRWNVGRHGLSVLAGLPALVVVGFAVAATSAPASRPIVADPCVR